MICTFQVKLAISQGKAVNFFKKRKLFFILCRRSDKKHTRFIEKTLCIGKHVIPNQANTAEGFGKQFCLLICRICSIFDSAIQPFCRHNVHLLCEMSFAILYHRIVVFSICAKRSGQFIPHLKEGEFLAGYLKDTKQRLSLYLLYHKTEENTISAIADNRYS